MPTETNPYSPRQRTADPQPSEIHPPNAAEIRPSDDAVTGDEGGGWELAPDNERRREADETSRAAKSRNIRQNVPGEGQSPGEVLNPQRRVSFCAE